MSEPSSPTPLSLLSIFPQAWTIYRTNYRAILGIVLTVLIPVYGLAYLWPGARQLDVFAASDPQDNRLLRLGIALFLAYLTGFAALAIHYLTARSLEQQPTQAKAALLKALSVWKSFLKTELLRTLLLICLGIAGFFGMFILGIGTSVVHYFLQTPSLPVTLARQLFVFAAIALPCLFLVRWMLIKPVIVLRDRSGLSALRESKHLVRLAWWKMAALLAIILGISFLVSYGFHLMGDAFGFGYFLSLLTSLSWGIVNSYFVVVLTVVFLQLEKIQSSLPVSPKKP